jgi:hypothetical protein
MKLIKSPLQFINFNLLKLEYKFTPNKDLKSKPNIKELFDSYDVEIDFAWPNKSKSAVVYTKISINKIDKPLFGYSIFIEGAASFTLPSATKIGKPIYDNLILYSATSININNLRDIIRQITADGPLGKYTLPAIDIQKQIKQKLDKEHK